MFYTDDSTQQRDIVCLCVHAKPHIIDNRGLHANEIQYNLVLGSKQDMSAALYLNLQGLGYVAAAQST